MYLNLIDQLAETNPQLFRELKSRLKPGHITMSVAISLTGQIFSLMLLGNHLNNPTPSEWQSWFWTNFMWLSGVGIFALLIVGTYMLIVDLSKEEEKGTLNLLRLSPESAKNILIGKLFGVPILLYIVALLALPLHLFSGLTAGISLIVILGFYAVLISSCIFFYSLALLCALLPIGKGNLKAGLLSGGLLLKLVVSSSFIVTTSFTLTPLNWLICFNPWMFLQSSLLAHQTAEYEGQFSAINWYGLSFDGNAIAIGIFLVLNYSLWSFWIWQGLQRWFHNPTTNLFTKAQSYWLTASWQITVLGFAVNFQSYQSREILWENFCILMFFNLVFYFVLIGVLTPRRQAIQDWARYRHYYNFGGKGKLLQDLVFGEKSPAVVAIAINAILASLIVTMWILFNSKFGLLMPALSSFIIAIALTLIYAFVVQLMLLIKSPQRVFWTMLSLAGLMVFPIAFSIVNYTNFDKTAWIWLFSIFPWVGLSVPSIAPLAVISACMIQWLGVTILGFQLQRRLKAIGGSKLLTA
ncbi:ABC transporter permease [Merismopedia glauca]|uniref:ABC transporter permease n=1 Tax=Merismopedia glauca CCAP 1448/3 TaxID=1296344 RepID=A0A2T1C920_9CYAN|nr:ABC transporter permease [Merismopedia glauca]PSB04746.1 ABC transporter permease [Merismopedia glauca CCAP 1448/3]